MYDHLAGDMVLCMCIWLVWDITGIIYLTRKQSGRMKFAICLYMKAISTNLNIKLQKGAGSCDPCFKIWYPLLSILSLE